MIHRSSQALSADQLSMLVGQSVDYTGDMANQAGAGAIVSVSDAGFGQYVNIALEDGRRVNSYPVCMLATEDQRNGCAYRVILTGVLHGAAYLAQLEAAAALRQINDAAALKVRQQVFQQRESARNIVNPPVFVYNGVKDARGAKLQKAWYSSGELRSFPAGTITIYADSYSGFSAAVHACFEVENDSDTMTDYFCKDTIRVIPSHPLYPAVQAALQAQEAHRSKTSAKRAERRAARG